uniref:translation initiation factor IF-2-like n=1 Tax=Callithrix jacchus TaxID=9483 RepID=UPI0023DD2D30|nr:translation initiation factor IF-2-like [Callithrix jacchus]
MSAARQAGAEKAEGAEERWTAGEPGGSAGGSRGCCSAPGPSRPLRARGRRPAGGRSGKKSCGLEGGEGAEELRRGWVLVLVGGSESLLPAGTGRRGHTWWVSSQGGVPPPRLPRPSAGVTNPSPPAPAARGSALRLRGLSNAGRGGVPATRAPRAQPPREKQALTGAAAFGAGAARAGNARPGF